MGGAISKKQEIKINDYNKVKIPKDYSLIKIGSYNVNLRNTINLDTKIKEIISYITSENKNKSLDIVNFQGIYDITSLYILIKEIKKHFYKNKLDIYFSPNFDNVEIDSSLSDGLINSKKMIALSFHSFGNELSRHTHGDKKKRKIIQNIIISKYPIISTIYSELDDKTDMDDILGIQTVIGANILIDNNIISVYNTALSKDIKSANILNANVRSTELDTLLKVIEKNHIALNHRKMKKYNKTDIHMICGTININELELEQTSQEYIDMISTRKFVDIFRFIHEKDNGYTTSFMERINYIMIQLTDDIFDESSKSYKSFQNAKNKDQIFKLLLKRYGIYFLDYDIIKADKNSALIYYPIECIFIIKTG